MSQLIKLTLNKSPDGLIALMEVKVQGKTIASAEGELPRLMHYQELEESYLQWQAAYWNLEYFYPIFLGRRAVIENASRQEDAFAACWKYAQVLEQQLNRWLSYEGLNPVIERINEQIAEYQLNPHQ
ncbi:MAG: hypothetical protein J7545_08785, partial [Roseofilum sp. SBFL]|uniref:hypothetical protein n=1 Tax=Roseofilum sp. SBFL TaxID=2821496 RepID=UPI001B085577